MSDWTSKAKQPGLKKLMRQHHLLSFLFPLALALQQPSVRFRALVIENVLFSAVHFVQH